MTLLILVSGPPAAGKTSLAEPVAAELGLPLLAKDRIKEALFDSLGTGDRDWSSRLSRATYAVLFALASAQDAAVLEANFDPPTREGISELCDRPIEVFVTAPEEEIVRRFTERERHSGHLDDSPDAVERVREAARRGPLDLGGPLLVLDSSLKELDASEVVAWIRSLPEWCDAHATGRTSAEHRQ